MVKLNFLKQCHYLDVVKDRIAHALTGHTFSRHPNNREVLHRTVRPLLSFGVVRLATGILYELDRYHEKMRL